MYLARSRPLFFVAFIACLLATGTSLYLEYGLRLVPCLLCILQRALFVILGAISLLAFIHAPGTVIWRVYSVGILLLAAAGLSAAGRQVWLETISITSLVACPNDPQCPHGSNSVVHLISQAFDSAVECAEVSWTLLTMSAAEWSLLAFVGLIVIAIYQIFQREPERDDPEVSGVEAHQD